jgi:hypothetical protein
MSEEAGRLVQKFSEPRNPRAREHWFEFCQPFPQISKRFLLFYTSPPRTLSSASPADGSLPGVGKTQGLWKVAFSGERLVIAAQRAGAAMRRRSLS